MIRMMRVTCVLTLALLLVACAGGSAERDRTEVMDSWESLVRWSEYDALVDFLHPDYLADHPVTALEVDRLRQFRVTEYRVRRVMAEPDGLGLERTVMIRLYHLHSAHERIIDHREVWRYDEELETWLLHSGLPDPRRR
ncbi:MAG: hypothetical protein V2J20_00560 [Wenzhouxiangella sp.]|nr:hypothetical protein [Wenzhouxiangella sp.]